MGEGTNQLIGKHMVSEINKIAKPSPLAYLMLAFFVLFSGGAATYGILSSWMVVAFPFALYYAIRNSMFPNVAELSLIVASIAVLLCQSLVFSGNLITVIRPISLVIVMYVSARALRRNFCGPFVNIVVFFSVCSLFFWLIDVFGGRNLLLSISDFLPQLGASFFEENELVGEMHTLYLYNINNVLDMFGYMRNAGPFWEPGRFVIYLNIALALNLFKKGGKVLTAKNIILIVTIITTFSTTGYIAFAILLLGCVIFSSRSVAFKIACAVMLIVPIGYLSVNLDFMQAKVSSEMLDVGTESSRFGAMFYHWLQIKDSPVIGYGPYINSVFGDNLFISPNGWTDLVRYFGFPLSIFMFFSLFFFAPTVIPIENYRTLKQTIVFLVIVVLAFTQTIMYSPFYYLLYFFSLSGREIPYVRKIILKEKVPMQCSRDKSIIFAE